MKKKYALLIATILFIQLNIKAIDLNQSAGTISILNSSYVNSMNSIWDINTGVNDKPVKITFTSNSETGYDYLTIYSIDSNGIATVVFSASGLNRSGSLTTAVPSGRARVAFTSDASVCYATNNLYTGFSLNFEVDNSTNIASDLRVNGSLSGNLTGGALKIQTNYGEIQLGPQNEYFAHIYTSMSKFYFGKPITIASGELSAFSTNPLSLQTNGVTRMSILQSNGNVGVGTPAPTQKLSVNDGNIAIKALGATVSDEAYNGALIITKPAASGQYINLIRQSQFPWSIGTVYNSNTFAIGYGKPNDAEFTTPFFNIDMNGKVGIGTTIPDQVLTVKGKIHAEEVIIDLSVPVADYVFDSSYKLMPLHQVEQYVKTNNHLPEIPSAAEVQKNGLSMGEMQNKLLQKVEELTLYVIEQQKRIEQLEKNQK